VQETGREADSAMSRLDMFELAGRKVAFHD